MLEKSCAFSKRYMYVKHSEYKNQPKWVHLDKVEKELVQSNRKFASYRKM